MGLQSFCLACARYSEGDVVGHLLAMVAATPYLVLYHMAVVCHARRYATSLDSARCRRRRRPLPPPPPPRGAGVESAAPLPLSPVCAESSTWHSRLWGHWESQVTILCFSGMPTFSAPSDVPARLPASPCSCQHRPEEAPEASEASGDVRPAGQVPQPRHAFESLRRYRP